MRLVLNATALSSLSTKSSVAALQPLFLRQMAANCIQKSLSRLPLPAQNASGQSARLNIPMGSEKDFDAHQDRSQTTRDTGRSSNGFS